ncbi:rhodanese-like domain-containing protein [Synechococcus sp. CS-602]|uniref:rhodanese-like domain-containing protein n=1 Tax=Synechococcaceae TaxID=1890426 RepID=UPI0009FA6EC5|nr:MULTISPECIES: rhodanese-like domain-containing protein [Synechococcaceae]MCT4363288.1 rhodanese-like domain-containing protein [Candidatus Regnicoccus frigidus MAG-AL1]MCT0202023.1 rhodanese-like domain-containing protein [Synechococcus sp. CS-603]MCT0205013.1 rhodanese-like domain-containing protein [Synechococcus sp. CS-602]MCT0246217.1 rhodanese-like domain-containing protein [Synechococcus sp. CS-601]MCT4367494.1 rhodanese-like domain-containing protein [Candidatus Regnicoccus frigidus 
MTSQTPRQLADQLKSDPISVVDVREPVEFSSGSIPGSRNIPLSRLGRTSLPEGPLVLVCQSGNRSAKGLAELLRRGHPDRLTDLSGGIDAWQQAGLPIHKRSGAPLPLMRQVQIAAGGLVLLGVILSTVAPGWIWLAGFVGAGLVFAGVSGFCGMARLLAAMPWNRVRA